MPTLKTSRDEGVLMVNHRAFNNLTTLYNWLRTSDQTVNQNSLIGAEVGLGAEGGEPYAIRLFNAVAKW